ncbi:competence protein CoiA family protein [Hydrogenophaga sp. RWCD_12]|uniref:competence protein CoiA family protein n=1 Tax=Hydrogenophaga sp. RWCD_12 TaxID=3391190 RepID=UPI003984EA95
MDKTKREKLAQKAREREAEEVGCGGLLRGIARNLHTGDEWEAEVAHKIDGPFYCPQCFSDVVIRKCAEKVDHFAHKARVSPVLGPKSKHLHDACAVEFRDAIGARYPDKRWEKERPIPASQKRKIPMLVPDVSGRMGDIAVAIEIQVSAMTLPKLLKRTRDYARRGINLVWVVPLSKPLGSDPFRPRLYERYLHSIFFGRVYYWWPGLGANVWPVHYGPAQRMLEYREWRQDGEDRSSGGYEVTYKVIRTPVYGPLLNLCDDFKAVARKSFTPDNERKAVPACLIWHDTLPQWW